MKNINTSSLKGFISKQSFFMLVTIVILFAVIINSGKNANIKKLYNSIPSIILEKMDYKDFERFQSYRFPGDIKHNFFSRKK